MSVTVNKTRLPGSVIKTASGAVASVSDARMRGAIGVEASFSPRQDLHGYSNPWPAGGGKNLFNKDDESSIIAGYITTTGFSTSNTKAKTVYIGIEPNTTYTVSKTVGRRFQIATADAAPSNGYAFTSRVTGNTSASLTITSGPSDRYLWAFVYLEDTDTGTAQAMIDSVQIELGSTATAWTPYENLCPISGITSASAWADPQYAGLVDWNQLFPAAEEWYRESAQSKVVVDDDGVISATLISGGPSVYAPAIRTATYPTVVANHIYYFACKFKPATDGYPYVRNTNGITVAAFGGQTTPGGTWGNYERIVGATGDADIYYFGQGGNTSQIQINDTISFKNLVCVDLTRVYGAGNEPLTVNEFRTRFPKDYYEYNPGEMMTISAVNGDPHTLTVQLGEERFGGSYDFVRGRLTLTMRMVNLGSLSWGTYSASYGKCFYATPSGGKLRFAGVCSSYRQNQVSYYNLANGEFCTYSGAGYSMFVRDDRYSDATGADFKVAVSGVQLCYELATPIVINLTPAEFELFHKQNFVWSDVGDTKLTYAAIHEH